jgi:hypothetical protein
MVQELLDLKNSVIEGRYDDALAIIDELEGMGKKAILRNITSYLVILLIHLIKNQVEQRLTNSWAVSITNALIEIKDLNLKANKKSVYIKPANWQPFLEAAFAKAVVTASLEVREGLYNPIQLEDMLDQEQLFQIAQNLLNLTYEHSTPKLPRAIYQVLGQLPGGTDWLQ